MSARMRSRSTPSIGPEATVGPFCYLRPGTVLEAGAKAGTFVEIKNSHIGEGAKVPHLSYIGDADVGEGTNIAAGDDHRELPAPSRPRKGQDDDRPQRQDRRPQCVRCSRRRSATMLGSAAGSVITEDVPPGALAIARSTAGQQGRISTIETGDD